MTTWTTQTVLCLAAYAFHSRGNSWTSEKDAKARGIESSAEYTVKVLSGEYNVPYIGRQDAQLAVSALLWSGTVEDDEHASPYEKKLAALIRHIAGSVPLESVGYVSTLIPAYADGIKKHQSKNEWSKLSNSKHVETFEPGDYHVVRSEPHTRTITKANGEKESTVQTLVILRDEQGNGYKWFDTRARGWAIGQSITIYRATIAGKSNYNGVDLTKINRVNIPA